MPNPKHGLAKPAKSDTRLLDAEKFLLPTYKRQPVIMSHGRGAYVFDSTGKKYLDFLGGIAVNALGHAHPRIVKVIRREAARAIHLSNLYHNAFQGPLARKLAEWSGLDRVFFANSGTEAVDGAMKLARLHGRNPEESAGTPAKKHRFLALENSFHGRTFGAVSVTATEKYRLPFAPVVPGVEFARLNDVSDLEAKFDSTVCAILLETVQGEGGIYPISEAFWNRARSLATQHDALLIADEIQCGLGRTGRSEEHTSELQSQSNLVCRLLLEKKDRHDSHPYHSRSHPPAVLVRPDLLAPAIGAALLTPVPLRPGLAQLDLSQALPAAQRSTPR